ncbi:endonuclease/exonuclease/phosphatase family protein [Mesorhizobium sp. BR1-1-16]|uniref:endonuclease/exonuclease/phosphatase family protein n=1 Tax=Mesorhizobium sp. BR1-1-16 TaxID=2876653 RepID=UPI001CCC0EFD|nr:endonuclease/exonuclease/phosphatase family protein [Mesorhizobium sp. BR1-1-16]MBZ9936519.1 endonuclease/exonuclease/phosphatase family protein [Mesorhizobium sp. BR1-1-16]
MSSILRFVFDASLVPIAVLVIVGRWGQQDWLFEMTNFFRPHIAVAALLFVLLAVTTTSVPRIAVSVLIFGAALVPLISTGLPKAVAAAEGNLRVMTANVLRTNTDFDRFRQVVAGADPDIVVMNEAVPAWRPTATSLPGLGYVTQPDPNSSVVVVSRYPMRSAPVQLVPAAAPDGRTGGARAVRVEIDRPGAIRPLVLYAIHAPTTRLARGWSTRNAYLNQIAGRILREPVGTDVIMAGDWNTSYWSPTLASILRKSGLVTTEPGPWPQPTRFFREFGLPPALGTPIDRIAVSKDIGLAGIKVSKPFGSDHLAVIAELAIP